MPGTLLKQLSTTAQANGTPITAGNSGFTLWPTPGTGAAGVHQSAAAMSEPVGYRMTQTSTGTVFGYLDLDAAVSVFAFRMPFRYSATPTATCVLLRGHATTAHADNLWSVQVATTNRISFVEATGGLNITSPSGSPLTPGSDYVMLGLIDTDTLELNIEVYPRGSGTELFTLAGTLVFNTDVHAVRLGIGSASSLAQFDTNSAFAIGSGDMLARTDYTVNLPPNAGPDQAVDAYTPVTMTGSDPEGVSGTWTQTGGSPTVISAGSANPAGYTAPAVAAGATLTFQYSDGTNTDSRVDTIYPHNEWANIGGVSVPIRISLATGYSGLLSGGELMFVAVIPVTDDDALANTVTIAREGGTPQTAENAESQARYLPAAYERTDLLMQTDAEAALYAGWVLHQGKDSETRFAQIVLDPRIDEDAQWPAVLGREIGDRITIISRRLASPIIEESIIRGIHHTREPGRRWQTVWDLSAASKYSFWTIGHATNGRIGIAAIAY